jgi:hypothetical protein
MHAWNHAVAFRRAKTNPEIARASQLPVLHNPAHAMEKMTF